MVALERHPYYDTFVSQDNRRALMYRNGGLPATQPLHLSVAHGTTVRLYLSDRGNWDKATTTVAQLKARLRKWDFTVNSVQYGTTVYGAQDAMCLRLETSDGQDEGRKLSDKQVAKLRKLVNPWCKAEGEVSITKIYHDNRHQNTEVSITVTDGTVPFTYAPPLQNVEYPLWEEDGAFKFLLATPVGKNAEDPMRAATIVAEELGIYLPERLEPHQFERRILITPPLEHPHGDQGTANYM